MAEPDDSFYFVLAGARRALEQVKADKRVSEPAVGRGAALAAHVTRVVAEIEGSIARSEALFPAAVLPAAKAAHIRNLRLYTQLARLLHVALPWLSRDQVRVLDLGTAYFIDEAAVALVGPGVEAVAVPDAEYMYSTLSWPFRLPVHEHLSTNVAVGTRPIVVFFPLKEAESVLLHALFAHELGHSAVDEHRLVESVVQPLRGESAYQSGLAAASSYYQQTYGWTPTRSDTHARGRLAQWLEELLCDSLALQFLGPSYLFSFAAFVLATHWNDPQPEHPPPTFRVSLLLAQLETLGWAAVVRSVRPAIWAWFEQVGATPLPALTPDTQFLHDMCSTQAPTIRSVVASRVAGSTFEPGMYDPVADHLASLYSRRILPAQYDDGSAIERRNILVAAWLFSLRQEVDEAKSLLAALEGAPLQRFVGKALEMSTVLESWRGLS